MDESYFEHAQRLETTLRQRAIEAASLGAAPETHPDFDGTHCVDCTDEIAAGRLALKKIRCIACQEDLEHGRRHM